MIDQDVSDKTRKALLGIVDAVSDASGGDAAIGASALCMAVHFFCLSTGWKHESFCTQLMGLKDREGK